MKTLREQLEEATDSAFDRNLSNWELGTECARAALKAAKAKMRRGNWEGAIDALLEELSDE